jgi:3-(3-hydroxy-phenyl)propionate hydroxylase
MESLDKMAAVHERPVVVAGLGPSGAVLALALARADIPVLILEKGSAVATDLRASTFHPPYAGYIGRH